MQLTLTFHKEAEKDLFVSEGDSVNHMVNQVVKAWIKQVKKKKPAKNGPLTNWIKFTDLDYTNLDYPDAQE